MTFRSYFKMPPPQTTQENCVAHNSSLVPVPGRDILVQAWYQGGVSLIDFTDSANPTEIAYFDRGPINTPNPTALNLGGLWSTYWYNGTIYGSEIARGFDTFGLLPSDQLSINEIDAASRSSTRTSSTPSTRSRSSGSRASPSSAPTTTRPCAPATLDGARRCRSATASRVPCISRTPRLPWAIQARLESAARMVPDERRVSTASARGSPPHAW